MSEARELVKTFAEKMEEAMRAADEWQAAHRIVFVPWMFTRMENLEKVEPEAETQP